MVVVARWRGVSKRRKRALCFLLPGLAVVALLWWIPKLVHIPFLSSFYCCDRFDSKIWKNPPAPAEFSYFEDCIRGRMVNDLSASLLHVGQSKAAILEALGQPSHATDKCHVYKLGTCRPLPDTLFRSNLEYLTVCYDPADRVFGYGADGFWRGREPSSD